MTMTFSTRAIAGIVLLAAVAACSAETSSNAGGDQPGGDQTGDGSSDGGGGSPTGGLSNSELQSFSDTLNLFQSDEDPVIPDVLPTGSVSYVGQSFVSTDVFLDDTPEIILGRFNADVDFADGSTAVEMTDLATYNIVGIDLDLDPDSDEPVVFSPSNFEFNQLVQGEFTGSGFGLIEGAPNPGSDAFLISGSISGQTNDGSDFEISGEAPLFGDLFEIEGENNIVVFNDGEGFDVSIDGESVSSFVLVNGGGSQQ